MDRLFAKFSTATARITGGPYAFMIWVVVVLVWALSGPVFTFSETWQLVINTGATIVTFLMVFLIQNTQNRDGAAIQTKLDELIRSSNAEDEFMGIETLTDKELDLLHAKCTKAAHSSQQLLEKAAEEKRTRESAKSTTAPQEA